MNRVQYHSGMGDSGKYLSTWAFLVLFTVTSLGCSSSSAPDDGTATDTAETEETAEAAAGTDENEVGKEQAVDDATELDETDDEDAVDDTTTTTTLPAAEFSVVFPQDGQVFRDRDIVFSGIGPPGAIVQGGNQSTTISPEGNWELALRFSEAMEYSSLFEVTIDGQVQKVDGPTVRYEPETNPPFVPSP